MDLFLRVVADKLVADVAERVAAQLVARAQAQVHDVWLTPKQAGELLGQSLQTLQMFRSKGTGPPYTKLGRNAVRYKRADIEAYLEAGKRLTDQYRPPKKRGPKPKVRP